MSAKTNSQTYYPADEVKLIHSGQEYFDLINDLVEAAQKEIHFHNYIFRPDATGRLVADALIKAAKRGVKIFILLDSFGSKELHDSEMKMEMKRVGIRVRFFSPFYLNQGLRLGRRMHQKVLVVDGTQAAIGGINVSDDYRGTDTEKAWLDYGVFIRGEVCKQLVTICMQLESNRYIGGSIKISLEESSTKPLVRFRQSDYVRNKRQISRAYTNAINDARKEIVIINAYFLPGTRLRNLLERAVKRGVKIHLILSSKSDVPIAQRAMNWFYDWLIRNNISVYEYGETNVHAKAAVFDGELAMIGSYNLNKLSEYMSVELNADIRDKMFAKTFLTELRDLMQNQSVTVDAAALKKRVWSNRLLNYMSYRLVSLSSRVLYILTRKEPVNLLE